MDLLATIRALYASDINCGLQTLYDGGVTLWIGDQLNGRKAEAELGPEEIGEAPAWLDSQARALYPQSDYAVFTPPPSPT